MDDELEGLRRNSQLRLTSEGIFTYRGRPLDNERVAELFHRGLALRSDGAVTLTVGPQWCYVEVEDVAFFGRRLLRRSGAGEYAVDVLLNTGERESLRPEALTWVEGGAVYLRLADGKRVARLLREVVRDLSPMLVEDDASPSGVGMQLGVARVPVAVVPYRARWASES